MIHHVSFDLWLTIIKSNPNYKKFKAALLSEELKTEFAVHKSPKECLDAIRLIGRSNDNMAEVYGANPMPLQIIHQLIVHLTGIPCPPEIHIRHIQSKFDELLLDMHPTLYSDETVEVLETLKKWEITTNISSNTGFSSGKVMRKVIQKLEIDHLIDFYVFSNEIGHSKPDQDFFTRIYVELLNSPRTISKENILHVGDNPKADIVGANKFGFKSLLINSNDLTINDVLTEVSIQNQL